MAGAHGDDIRAALDRLSAAGFRFVQLSATQAGLRPRELDQSARRDLLATLRRRELTLAGLDVWIPPAHFSDPLHCDRAVAAVNLAIELAADLGRCPISFSLPNREGGAAPESPLPAVIQSIAAHAQRFGVELADHAFPVNQNESGVGLGIDPAAWLSHGADPASVANLGNILSARLCDLLTSGMRGPIGGRDGRLDTLAYKVALSIGGYARSVVLDARQWIDPWKGISQSQTEWASVP